MLETADVKKKVLINKNKLTYKTTAILYWLHSIICQTPSSPKLPDFV